MNRAEKNEAYSRAKKMIVDGEPWDNIMAVTSLRLNDLKKIQHNEIINNF